MRFLIDHKWYCPSWLHGQPPPGSSPSLSRAWVIWLMWAHTRPCPGHWTLAPPEESGEWSPVTSGAETRQEQRDTQEPCDVRVTRWVTKHEQTTYHCNYITLAPAQVILIQISASPRSWARDSSTAVKVRENISVRYGDNLWWNCKYSVNCQGKIVHSEESFKD